MFLARLYFSIFQQYIIQNRLSSLCPFFREEQFCVLHKWHMCKNAVADNSALVRGVVVLVKTLPKV